MEAKRVYFTKMNKKSALDKFIIIQPYLKNDTTLVSIAKSSGHSIRNLHRWVNQYQEKGLEGLMVKSRSDKSNHRVLSEKTIQMIEALVLQKPKRSKATIHRLIVGYSKENQLPIPSYSTVSNVINNIPADLRVLAHEGTTSYEQQYEIIFRREASKPNEIWQADHTLLDINVLDCNGALKRPWLTVIMDDYSRAIVGYYISFDAPSALQTSLALHQAIWTKNENNWPACGIPEIMYTDHGSDFTSKHIESVCVSLKIQLIFSTVGKPRGRGKVERFFLTINQCLLQDLPGSTQCDVHTKHLTIEEFEEKTKSYIIDNYNHKEHSSTKETPISRWQNGLFLPLLPEKIAHLDLLLLTVKKSRKVHRDGIKFQGFRYFSTTLASYVGESVYIRYDPRDLAEIRVFFNDDFICTAVSQELDTDKVSLKEIIKARKEKKKLLRCVIKKSRNMVDARLLHLSAPSSTILEPQTLNDGNSTNNSQLKRYHNE